MAACLALLIAGAPAAGAAKSISGKLSKPGYTVIALEPGGEATPKPTKSSGKFKLRPPAQRVSLHLRAADGTYAGPIVIERKGKKGKKAILGVEAGAELGKVKVRDGYAKLKRELEPEDVDRTRRARAKKGVPIGARVFGRVASKASGTPGPGEDLDRDGVPDALDIDDDGDLILDSVDPPAAASARAARGPQPPPPETLSVLPILSLDLAQTANANHPALAAQIDTALSRDGALIFGADATTELDCAGDPAALPPRPGLVYCSSGGTGRLAAPPMPAFPECCDSDEDGFGTPPPFSGPPQLVHGATSEQIKTGDWLVARLNDANGVEIGAFTQLLPYVFATVPALVSYHDSAEPLNEVTLDYPYAPGFANELPVAAGPDGDVVVTVTFWRPQRTPIGAGPDREACLDNTPPCDWIDIGGLNYAAGLGAGECLDQSAFSETDPNLTDRPPGPFPVGGFRDSRQPPDQPANPNETLTFTLNITQCLESQGLGSSFDEPGETRMLRLIATGGGRADQAVTFKLE